MKFNYKTNFVFENTSASEGLKKNIKSLKIIILKCSYSIILPSNQRPDRAVSIQMNGRYPGTLDPIYHDLQL